MFSLISTDCSSRGAVFTATDLRNVTDLTCACGPSIAGICFEVRCVGLFSLLSSSSSLTPSSSRPLSFVFYCTHILALPHCCSLSCPLHLRAVSLQQLPDRCSVIHKAAKATLLTRRPRPGAALFVPSPGSVMTCAFLWPARPCRDHPPACLGHCFLLASSVAVAFLAFLQ